VTLESRDYLRQWTAPPTILAVAGMAVTLYASHVVQQERIAALKLQVERVERDYQRRDVLTETLRTIDMRLTGIEMKLDERVPTIGPTSRGMR
jgi:hypothetical protein